MKVTEDGQSEASNSRRMSGKIRHKTRRSFGATAPPFLDYLKDILRRYPDGGQILKELIQNADDACATEVIFIHDERSYGTESLWNANLGQYQGPALYAYNNAVFTEDDWERIQMAGRSGKINDPNKIGRFGIGFNSVYHITDADLSLLFLKSVNTVSLIHISQDGTINTRLQIKSSEPTEVLLKQEDESDVESSTKIKLITLNSEDQKKTQWLLTTSTMKEGKAPNLDDLAKKLSFFPRVDLAFPLDEQRDCGQGRLSCFLPLPNNESNKTGLPVYVNACFGLTDNRRHIKWQEEDQKHDEHALWNELLVKKVLPQAYVKIIQDAIKLCQQSTLPVSSVYDLWPDVTQMQHKDKWLDIAVDVFHHLFNENMAVLSLARDETQFVPLSKAVIPCNGPTTAETISAIKRTLVSCGENLVSVPATVVTAIETFTHTNPQHVTPRFLRVVLHRTLLPYCNHLFIPHDLRSTCRNHLEELAKLGVFQVININKKHIEQYTRKFLPQDWKQMEKRLVTWNTNRSDHPPLDWLRGFWRFLNSHFSELSCFMEIPLIPVSPLSNSQPVSLAKLQQKTTLIFQNRGQKSLPDQIAQLVTKTGATVVRGNEWLKHDDLETYVPNPSPRSIMKVLMNLDSGKVIRIMKSESQKTRENLKDYLSHLNALSGQEKDFLMKLPLFQTMSGSLVTAQSKQALVLTSGLVIPSELPVPDSIIQCATEADHRLLKLLKVNLLSPDDVGIILIDSIKNGTCSSQGAENIMTWILQHGDILFSQNQYLKCKCKELRFIKVKRELKQAADFLSPTVKAFKMIFESDSFPPPVYTEKQQMLKNLIDLGLINKEADLTPEHVLYATTLIENLKENSEKEIRHTMYEEIVGEVMPLMGKLSDRVNTKLGLKRLPPPEKVIENLSVLKSTVRDMDGPDTNVDFKKKLHSIYRHMQQNISEFAELMNREPDWLWANDKFVSPCDLVLNYPQDLDLSSYIGKCSSGLELFSDGEHWCSMNNAIFLHECIEENAEISRLAAQVCKKYMKAPNFVVPIPLWLRKSFKQAGQEKVLQDKTWTWEKFYQEMVFKNLATMDPKTRDTLVLHAVDLDIKEIDDLLTFYPCIPTSDGELQYIKKLVNPSGRVACLFEPDEGRLLGGTKQDFGSPRRIQRSEFDLPENKDIIIFSLKSVKLIRSSLGRLETASYYYDDSVELYKKMVPQQKFVPQTFWTDLIDGKLHTSSSLYCNDTVFEIQRLKEGLENKFLLLEKLSECYLGNDIFEQHRLVKMLPQKLQPKMLSQITEEKVVESNMQPCELGDGCEFRGWFDKHLSSEGFKDGVICLLREQTEDFYQQWDQEARHHRSGRERFFRSTGSRFYNFWNQYTNIPRPNKEEAQRWCKQARCDLDAAHKDTSGGSTEWCLFKVHQAVEKALIAAEYKHDGRHTSSSSISTTAANVSGYHPQLRDLPQIVADLKSLGVDAKKTQYPNCHPFPHIPNGQFRSENGILAVNKASELLNKVEAYSCIHVLVSCLVLMSKSLSLNALVIQGIPILLSPGVGQKENQKTGGGNPLVDGAPHMLYAT
ncbi:hypothetical protein CCH79_00002928 [Gambusia affinis]|uniref:HEPN domain-containing protein n=1 Tax=Gambusia affinis TaxID=33528 RepID=A0A315W6N4_GAMAF|nr:hypothetical protein CCH79_00002928 [Gambusia affinis]